PLEWLYSVTLQGRIEVVLLAAGLLLTGWLEGRRHWTAFGNRPDLMLSGEQSQPAVFNEWAVATGRFRGGIDGARQVLTYFRHRRAFALARSQVAPSGPGAEQVAPAYVTGLEESLLAERERVESPNEQTARPRRSVKAFLGQLWTVIKAHRLLLLIAILLIAVFLVLRATGSINYIYGRPLALIIALASLAYAGWRLRRFLKQPPPDQASADGETLAAHHGHAILAFAAVGIAACAVVVWFLPQGALVPTSGLAFSLGVLSQWVAATGAAPSGLLGLGGLAAPTGECKDCGPARDAVEAGKKELARLAEEAAPTQARAAAARAALEAARKARREAQSGLDALKNESYIEGTAGRLAGSRLTTGDLRRQRQQEAAIRARFARGEISRKQMEDELSQWADEDYVRKQGAEGEADREAQRKELQDKLDKARADEEKARPESEAADAAAKAAGDALAAERAAQDQREAALAECEGNAPPKKPAADISDLERAFDQAQRDFDKLEEELSKAMDAQAQDVQKWTTDYNQHLAQSLKDLDAYLAGYAELAPDLADLWQAYRDMAGAKAMAAYFDKIIDTLMKIDIARAGAKLAVSGIAKGLLPGLEAAASGDATLAAKANELANMLKEGEQLAAKEATEASATAAKTGLEVAGEDALGVTAKGGAEDVAAAMAKPVVPGAVSTGVEVEGSALAQKGITQANSSAATLGGDQLAAVDSVVNKELKALCGPIRKSAIDDQCTQVSEAFAKTWKSGEQYTVMSDVQARKMWQMEKLFDSQYIKLGQDPVAAQEAITKAMQTQGPGSQALVLVKGEHEVIKDGVATLEQYGHSFNVVNSDGFVKFVDVADPKFILTPDKMAEYHSWYYMPVK
ncbi:MAG: toxin glutamine deamidase domain-containing protein, partial [Candidatus Dormiibacterota bacterium]